MAKPKFRWWWILVPFGDIIFTSMWIMAKDDPKEEAPTPLEGPSTELGTPLGVLFGRHIIPNPIIVWYGDVKILKVPIDTQGKK